MPTEGLSPSFPKPCLSSFPRPGQASRLQFPISANEPRYAAIAKERRSFSSGSQSRFEPPCAASRYFFIEIMAFTSSVPQSIEEQLGELRLSAVLRLPFKFGFRYDTHL